MTLIAKRDEVPLPGVLAAYGYGGRVMWRVFWPMIGIYIVMFLMGLPLYVVNIFIEEIFAITNNMPNVALILAGVMTFAYMFGVQYPVGMGLYWVYLQAARGERVGVGHMFAVFQRNYKQTILLFFMLFILTACLLVIFLLLGFYINEILFYPFLIPVVYYGSRLIFAFYLIVDHPAMTAVEAIQASWAMTERHFWRVMAMWGISIPLILIGYVIFIVGTVFANIWVNVSLASLYHSIEVHEGIPGVHGKRKNDDLEYA